MTRFVSDLLLRLKSFFSSDLRRSNFGRMDGWFIEFDGEIVGELIEYRQEDMFWDSYRIVPKNELSEKIIAQKELWDKCKFRVKNKRNSIYANGAFHLVNQRLMEE